MEVANPWALVDEMAKLTVMSTEMEKERVCMRASNAT